MNIWHAYLNWTSKNAGHINMAIDFLEIIGMVLAIWILYRILKKD